MRRHRARRRNPGGGSLLAAIAGFVAVPYAAGALSRYLRRAGLSDMLSFELTQAVTAGLARYDAARREPSALRSLERGAFWGALANFLAYPVIRAVFAGAGPTLRLAPAASAEVQSVYDTLPSDSPPPPIPPAWIEGSSQKEIVVSAGLRLLAFVELPFYIPTSAATPDAVRRYAEKKGWRDVKSMQVDGSDVDLIVEATWKGDLGRRGELASSVERPSEVRRYWYDRNTLPAAQF